MFCDAEMPLESWFGVSTTGSDGLLDLVLSFLSTNGELAISNGILLGVVIAFCCSVWRLWFKNLKRDG